MDIILIFMGTKIEEKMEDNEKICTKRYYHFIFSNKIVFGLLINKLGNISKKGISG